MAQIADIIKYEGDNSTFIWKHPCEDFNSLTQLIVHESQEAVFFMNGQALDLFGAGRYTLETQNIPKVGKLLNRTTGGETPFHCEVYFINKTVQMAVKWGTESKARYIDPEYGVPIELGACGEMNLQVSDSRKLLIKLVGTMNGIAWADNPEREKRENLTQSLHRAFRPLISTSVKSHLSSSIKQSGIDLFEVDEHIGELSEILRKAIIPGFEEYGLTVPQFYLTNVLLPENDPNFKRIRELHTISLQQRMAQAEASVKTSVIQSQADIEAARHRAQIDIETAKREEELAKKTTEAAVQQVQADVEVAKRQAELERQTTETEIARRQAERDLIAAQAAAQAQRMSGLAEAEIMQAKGYSQKDVLQADVQKAYAEGLGNMGANGGGLGDIASLGVTLGAMGGVMGLAKDAVAPMFGSTAPAQSPAQETEKCPACGKELPAGAKFCLDCGVKIEKLADNEMICPACGKKTPKGKFCIECGAPLVKKCPNCGAEVPEKAKFCLDCGTQIK